MKFFDGWRKRITSTANQLVAVTTQVSQAVQAMADSASVRETVSSNLSHAMQAIGQAIRWPAIVGTMIRSKEVRTVVWHSAQSNFFNMGVALAIERIAKPVFRSVPGMEESFYMASLFDLTLRFLFFRFRGSRSLVENIFYNLVTSATATQAIPVGEHFKTCAHADKHVRADVESTFYYLSNTLAVYAVSRLPYMSLLAYPLSVAVEGVSLVEFKLSAAGMCTEDRYELLSKNNAYCLAFGTSFVFATQISSYGVWLLTGAASPIIDAAISSFMFQQFIILALLQNEPLPGTKAGYDFTYYTRYVTDEFLRHRLQNIKDKAQHPKHSQDFLVALQGYFNFMWQHVAPWLVHRDLHSLEQAVREIPAVSFFAQLHEPSAAKILPYVRTYGTSKTVEWAAEKTQKVTEWLSERLPSFCAPIDANLYLKIYLSIAHQENIENLLNYIDYLLSEAWNSPFNLGRKRTVEVLPDSDSEDSEPEWVEGQTSSPESAIPAREVVEFPLLPERVEEPASPVSEPEVILLPGEIVASNLCANSIFKLATVSKQPAAQSLPETAPVLHLANDKRRAHAGCG